MGVCISVVNSTGELGTLTETLSGTRVCVYAKTFPRIEEEQVNSCYHFNVSGLWQFLYICQYLGIIIHFLMEHYCTLHVGEVNAWFDGMNGQSSHWKRRSNETVPDPRPEPRSSSSGWNEDLRHV